MGEDKSQPLISLWINSQACPCGAMVWGFGTDKQHLSSAGGTHDSGVFERKIHREEGISQGHRPLLSLDLQSELGVISPITGCTMGESSKCESTLQRLHSCLDL